MADAASQYGVAMEISQGSNEFEFSVPYVALQPYMQVPTGANTTRSSMGTLSVVIMNPLVAPTTVAPKISVIVYIAGSSDFSYEYLASVNPAVPVYVPAGTAVGVVRNEALNPLEDCTSGYEVVGESGVLDDQSIAPTNIYATVTDVVNPEEDHQIAPPQVEMQVDDHFGITSLSLRNLGKKYQLAGLIPMSVNRYDPKWLFATLDVMELLRTPAWGLSTIPNNKLPMTNNAGLLTWMSSMYRQFKGSFRFKVVIVTNGNMDRSFQEAAVYLTPGPVMAVAFDQQTSDISTMVPEVGPSVQYTESGSGNSILVPTLPTERLGIMVTRVGNVLEFEVPYNSAYLSVLAPSGVKEAIQDMGSMGLLTIVMPSASGMVPLDYSCSLKVYVALGDESRFGMLYRVPSVYAAGVYALNSTGSLTSISNFGYGMYKTVPFIRRKESSFVELNLSGESGEYPGLDRSSGFENPEYQKMIQDILREAESDKTPGNVASPGGRSVRISDSPSVPSNPQLGNGRRRRPLNMNQIRACLMKHVSESGNGLRLEELRSICRSVAPRSMNLNQTSQLLSFARANGIRETRDGLFTTTYGFGRKRTNRRPLQIPRRRGALQ